MLQGGRLCFFVNDHLHMLDRPRGSTSQHPAKVLHGVTALTEGTRKSLFVVDQQNGLGDDPTAVLTVTETQVDSFLAFMASLPSYRVKKCVICADETADHVLVPCGHMCLCSHCVSAATECPLCRVGAKRKVQVFL